MGPGSTSPHVGQAPASAGGGFVSDSGGGYVGGAAGSSGRSAELSAGNEGLLPHGKGQVPSGYYGHGVRGLPAGVGRGVGAPFYTIVSSITCPPGSSWRTISSSSAYPAPGAPSGGIPVSNLINLINIAITNGKATYGTDGWVYFTSFGIPFRLGSDGATIQTCVSGTGTSPSTGGVGAVVGVSYSAAGAATVKYLTTPLNPSFFNLPLPPNAPPPDVATFVTAPGLGQFSWVFVNSAPGARPAAPPPGATLPGAWILVRPHFWMWYPSPPRALAVVNTYFVVTNSDRMLGIPNPGLTKPTAPPPQVAGTAAGTGQWVNSGPSYWVWVPTTSMVATPATSYSWIWWLLGIGVVGGGAYYLLD